MGPAVFGSGAATSWEPVPGNYSRSLTDVAVVDDTLVDRHVERIVRASRGQNPSHLFARGYRQRCRPLRSPWRPDGKLWIGTSGGIDVYQNGKRVAHFGGAEGLPCTDVYRLLFDEQGVLWVATARGLARYDGKSWTWRHSLRWLPSDDVHDVALADDGTAYVATTGGLSILKRKKMTLADKAEHYEQLVALATCGHRDSWSTACCKSPATWRASRRPTPITTECTPVCTLRPNRFALPRRATRQAAENARESYRAIEFLQTVTDTPGFVARTVIPSDWTSMADREPDVHAAAGGSRTDGRSAVQARRKPLAQEPRRQMAVEGRHQQR